MNGLIETEAGYIDFALYTEEAYDKDGNEIEGESYVKIDNLFVNPGFRGKGCARALLTLAVADINNSFPGKVIKIVAEPKEDCVDFSRLADFYESFGLDVIAV